MSVVVSMMSRVRGGRLRSRWTAAGVLVLTAVCLAASASAAVLQRGAVRADQRHAFDVRARDVATSMGGALHRNNDFVAALRSTVVTRPDMTNAEFSAWIRDAQAFARDPGGIGFAFTAYVAAARLPAFGRTLVADPVPLAMPARRFAPFPSGARGGYCIIRLAVVAGAVTSRQPLGMDYCATNRPGIVRIFPREVLFASRDSGQFAVVPLDMGHGIFAITAPVYRGGQIPATVAARRAALLGWVTGTYSGTAIVSGGGVGTHTSVQISHRNPGETTATVLARAGVTARQGMSRDVRVAADGDWIVRVSGTSSSAGLSATTQFWIILLAGLAMSGLLVAFVLLLARGRGRALSMVERKTDELQHLALHDALTGLPNRALILDRAEQALARARRSSHDVAALFLDLDAFKAINDTLGHAAGDRLLCAVGARLTTALRSGDTVGRLGGDEFVIIVDGDAEDADPEAVAARIHDALDAPFALGDADEHSAMVQASIGIATGTRERAEDLLRDADIALYEAKAAGKGRSALFAPEMHASMERRRELEHDLRAALDTDQLYLVYQPIVDLATRRITGVEALVRWQHPVRGLIMPDEFIPLAEETALIVPMGRRILRQACMQAAAWNQRGHRLGVAVNVSGRQLDADVDLMDDVRDALRESGLAPADLTLEITETMLMRDADLSGRRLADLKAIGVRIAIDDFGTGYSSMGSLRRFPVDSIKIDRCFVNGLGDGTEAAALLHTLVQLGKTLNIETLAEGIEEPDQLEQLQAEECDSGQGYFFARPLAADAIEALLDAPSVECHAA